MRAKMLFVISLLWVQKAAARPRCGGSFTAARGVIHTPGFPGPFPTPIHCEWVIDAQHLLSKNTSIVVYLTELFVFEGLKFTEYQVYDESFRFNGRDLLVVNETNIVDAKTVQTNQSYLVISLKLTTLDGTQLRILDHFLNSFGFNATYEIREGGSRSDVCNMMDCGFNGICYDYFNKFGCSCFGNYSGRHCSEGPSSLCETAQHPFCKNGGTCRHVGATAVKCLCSEGFAGNACETSVSLGITEEGIQQWTERNDISCNFSGEKSTCMCPKTNNHTGFFATMHLGNLPNLKDAELQDFIRNQILRILRAEIPKLKDVYMENMEINTASVDVTVRIHSDKKDVETLKSVFTSWSTRKFIGNLTVLEEDMNFGTILPSVSLTVNKPTLIRVHEDFILTCAARGNSGITFRWLKDGMLINTSHSAGRKWQRIIKDPHVDGQYTALLGAVDADVTDGGVFTCQVEDFGFQRCVSKRIRIKEPPAITLDPMSLTVRKGDNFTVKCICPSVDSFDRHTYSWTKNRELLAVRTEWGSYDVLYPTGSILQVYKVKKSTTYSCLVQDGAVSSEASIDVIVVGVDGVETCNAQQLFGVTWPVTAPDSESVQRCPEGYLGKVYRQCSLAASGPSWRTPNFSQCTSVDLYKISESFRSYCLGYETSLGPAEMLSDVLLHLDERPLLPGEGTRVLAFLRDFATAANSTCNPPSEGARTFLDILDKIIGQRDALINEMQVKILQQFIKDLVLHYMSPQLSKKQSILRRSSATVDISIAAVDKTKSPFLRIPFFRENYPEWFSYKLEVNVEHAVLGDTRPVLVSVVYRNLSSFLPRRSTIRLDDDVEKDYILISEIVANWFIDGKTKSEIRPLHGSTLSMEFRHRAAKATLRHWEARCAVAEFATFGNSWDILACNTEKLNDTSTRCFCTRAGTFAVILTDKLQKNFSEKLEIHKFVVLVGCSICFILSTASGLVLLVYWSQTRTCLLFVKLQCCFSVSGAMMVFIVALATADDNQSTSYAMCMMVFLETFLLIAASTQLSKLLVVYAEFVHFPKPSGAKLTVIGIITGVPLLAVFGNHTAHRAMNVKLKTWWIVTGSLSFYVFMTCFVIIILLYVFVYFVVESKIHQFLKFHHKSLGCFQQRIYLLHRSALIFIFLITTTLSSIAYVNYTSEIYWHYEFSAINISLGVVIVISYVVKKDNLSYMDILQKLKNEKRDMIIANSKNKHLTFYTKEDAEAESESTPESHYASRPTKVRFASEPQIDLIEHPPEVIGVDVLENYKNSPKSFRTLHGSSDVLQREAECLELDLVISFRPDDTKKVNLVRPRIAIANPDQDSAPKLEFKTFHKNCSPEATKLEDNSKEVVQKKEEKKGAGTSKDLDVVLTSISQDLDYLLNQEEDLRDTLKKKRTKSPGRVTMEVVEGGKYPESLTGISRTHC